MSLLIHCPFTEDWRNIGLTSTLMSSSNASIVNNGKIGAKCLQITGTGTYVSYHQLENKRAWSVAVWARIDSTTDYTLWADIFSLETKADSQYGTYTGLCRIERNNSSNPNTWGWYITTYYSAASTGTSFVTGIKSGNNAGAWHHLTITFDGVKGTAYYDGAYLNSANLPAAITNLYLTGRVEIGNANPKASINDFRVYDHCLSEKEVKEISKGLILHYPLNEPFKATLNNLYTGNYTLGYASSSSFTLTLKEGYTNWKLSRTGNGTNIWLYSNFPTVTRNVGKTYVWSCLVRINSISPAAKLAGLVMRKALIGNDYTNGGIGISNAPTGLWTFYLTECVIPEKSNQDSTKDAVPLMLFRCGNLSTNGADYSFDIDITNISVAEKYIPDCSGYCNNGTVNGNLTTSTDTPRYDKCTVFSTNSNITIPLILNSHNNFSISMWLKANSITTQGSTHPYLNYSNSTIRILQDNTTNGIYLAYIDATNTTRWPLLVNDTNWHHIAITSNGTYTRAYVDGTEKFSNASGILAKVGNTIINSGTNNYTPSISDVRVYVTALSADDVKELYNTSASLDKNGNLLTYQLIES